MTTVTKTAVTKFEVGKRYLGSEKVESVYVICAYLCIKRDGRFVQMQSKEGKIFETDVVLFRETVLDRREDGSYTRKITGTSREYVDIPAGPRFLSDQTYVAGQKLPEIYSLYAKNL